MPIITQGTGSAHRVPDLPPSIDSALAKLNRAWEHFYTLNAELRILNNTKPDGPAIYFAEDGPWHVVCASPQTEPFPLRLSVICGDIYHELRSGLDHLVNELVRLQGGVPTRWNAFPIISEPGAFASEVKRRVRNPERSPLYGIDVNSKAWKLIEEAQPYKTGDEFLATLGRFNNRDKHRALHVHLAFPVISNPSDLVGWSPSARLLEFTRSPSMPFSLEESTELMRLRFEPGMGDPEMYVQGPLLLQPTFGDGMLQAPFDWNEALISYVTGLLKKFLPLF